MDASRGWAIGLWLAAPAAAAQVEVQRLLAPNPAPSELFGGAVDLDGGRLAVGAWLADRVCPRDPRCDSGVVWVFERAGGVFEPVAELWPGDALAGDKFGTELALGGDLLAVSTRPQGAGVTRLSEVYVYERGASGWQESVRLRLPGQEHGDLFGAALLVDGESVFVGAPDDDHTGFAGAGSVHLFERDAGRWRLAQSIVAWVPCPGMSFGAALAFGHEHLFVGSPGDAHSGVHSGSVHVYRRGSAGWVFEQRLVASDADWYEDFGGALAAQGSRLVVAAAGKTVRGREDAGALYVFEHDGFAWRESAKLTAWEPHERGRMGSAVGLRDSLICASTPLDDPMGEASGSLHLFQLTRAGWRQAGTLVARAGAQHDFMGLSADLEGDLLVAGATGADGTIGEQIGAVHVFEVPRWAASGCGCERNPCGAFGGPQGCPNASGRASSLGAAGSVDLAADDLSLHAAGLPAHVPAFLAFGSTAGALPFGNGWRCIARGPGAPLRLTRALSTAGGRVIFGPGLSPLLAPWVRPGERWTFQVDYHDAGGPCGREWNTTPAVSVRF